MENKLGALQEVVPDITINTSGKVDEVKIDIDSVDEEVEKFLSEFNKQVQQIETNMEEVKSCLIKMKDFHVKAITATISSQKKRN